MLDIITMIETNIDYITYMIYIFTFVYIIMLSCLYLFIYLTSTNDFSTYINKN